MQHSSMERNVQHLTNQFSQLFSGPQDDLLQRRAFRHATVQGRCSQWQHDNRSLLFSVASYNILSQALLEDHLDMYQHLDFRFLAWNHRKQKLIQELKHYEPDIICLQEVEQRQFEEFFVLELGEKGYKGEFKKRTGDKADGCATFYKSDKFICETVVDIEYHRSDLGLDRDNIGLVVLLQPRQTTKYGGKLCIANTHLLYNPRRGDIKLAQLMLLLAKIDEVAKISGSGRHPYHPIIVCGDLNLEPNSDLYLFLCRGQLQYEGLLQSMLSGQTSDFNGRCYPMQANFLGPQRLITHDCHFTDVMRRRCGQYPSSDLAGIVTHGLNLTSAYPHITPSGSKEITTSQEDGPVTVDYILYSVASKRSSFRSGRLQFSDVQEGNLSLVRVLDLLTDHDFRRFGGLPTRNTPSDHLLLCAEFCLHN